MCEFAPTALTYLVNRTSDDEYAAVELLDNAADVQARFLVKILETKTAIRGLYTVNCRILARIPCSPDATTFHKGYFTE